MLLSDRAFEATCVFPMRRLAAGTPVPFDFWPYVDAIPEDDFAGHDCAPGRVTYVWESADGAYQHVLIDSDRENLFMAVVLDVQRKCVVGHRILDLERTYGLDGH